MELRVRARERAEEALTKSRRARQVPYCAVTLVALALALSACETTSGIRARDSFMLAYTDNNDRVQVRHSDDGWDWTASAGVTDETSSGVGSAASNDSVGTTRLLAYRNLSGRLSLHFGLGTDTWESQELVFENPGFFSAPQVVHLAGQRWLMSTTDVDLRAAFKLYNNATRQFTDETPTDVGPVLRNDLPARTPAMANRSGRLLAAWLRFEPSGAGLQPAAIQLVLGNVDSNGALTWTTAQEFAQFDEPGFGPVLAGPSVTHDESRFLMAVIRKANGVNVHRLFVYGSTDGLAWQSVSTIDNVPFNGSTHRLGFAAHANGTMVAVVLGGQDQLFVNRGTGWIGAPRGNVFGRRLPVTSDFSVVAVGRRRLPIFVNRDNTGDQDGTAQHPYRTIREALSHAVPGDHVVIQGNRLYQEGQLRVPRGVTLRSESTLNPPFIQGDGDGAVVILEREAAVRGVTLADGRNGVSIDIGTVFEGREGDTASAVTVEDCTIVGSLQRAISVTSPTNLTIADDDVRAFSLLARRNWLKGSAGTAIHSDVTGSETGRLVLDMDVRDNVIVLNGGGIALTARGRGPGSGQQVRTWYRGRISDNLVAITNTGISLDAAEGSAVGIDIDPLDITQNTIARTEVHAIVADAIDNESSVRTRLVGNIVANNSGVGFFEFSPRTNPAVVSHNLFFANAGGHYFDDETDGPVDTAADLNGAPVNGNNNLVADPRFEQGSFRFGLISENGDEAEFFLRQGAANPSPAVDAGPTSATEARLSGRTTRTNLAQDSGEVDIGFHYPIP